MSLLRNITEKASWSMVNRIALLVTVIAGSFILGMVSQSGDQDTLRQAEIDHHQRLGFDYAIEQAFPSYRDGFWYSKLKEINEFVASCGDRDARIYRWYNVASQEVQGTLIRCDGGDNETLPYKYPTQYKEYEKRQGGNE